MTLSPYLQEVAKRRTFAIISHPDAGKTTITEKVLLFGQAIQTAGTVKGRGSNQHAKSDWMEMEKQRGISITTSVMQFPYHDCLVNLLDTPGHEDFSEDTYRTLTAVDCCLMVIDAAKGVEDRTRKLMEVTRLRDTPILTFMNKLDRDIRDPMELLDEVENELKIGCAPITWPIGCGKLFKGVYHLYKDETYLYQSGKGHTIQEVRIVKGLNNPDLDAAVGEDLAQQLRDELELVKGASNEFDKELFLAGEITPVFFGTALGNFGVDHMLDGLVEWAPAPMPRQTDTRTVEASEDKFTGFVFKIQANMDPKHRDRVAFMRVVSGKYEKGMKLRQVRTAKDVVISDALTFMAGDRSHVTLVEGSVEVCGARGDRCVRIEPGEDASLNDDGSFAIRQVDTDVYVYWKEGYFFFDDAPLSDIMQQIGRWYNVDVVFDNTRAMSLRLHFFCERAAGIEAALAQLNILRKFKAEYRDGVVHIY